VENLPGSVIAIGLGIAVLFLGRNLRLFAAAAGFLIGVSLVQALVPGGSLLLAVLFGAALAVLGVILLAIGKGFVQLIVQIIGAVASAGIALWLLQSLGLEAGLVNWIIAIAAAVAGFVLMARFFDVGIIILTSLLGASLIARGMQAILPLSDGVSTVATLALAVIGIIVQRRPRGG
jgi:hypothetical protein